MPKKCLTCKSSNDIPTEEIPYWSKKKEIILHIQK